MGAAVTIADDDDADMSAARARVAALIESDVDAVALEGDLGKQIALLKWGKAAFPAMQFVCGNVATVAQVREFCEAGADCLRVGVGVGSVATGQLVKAVGRPQ